MALLWRKRSRDKTYEVRQAGASTRLYTNGVFHSQYNHRQPLSGNLWNMLALPAYLHQQPQSLQRIAVLGVGGGAVVRHLLQIAPAAEVVGVDLDKTHLQIACRYFGLTDPRIRLVHANAVQWLEEYSGAPFDLIVDDLFGEATDEHQLPQRAVPVTQQWLMRLQEHLAPGGVLAFNLESPRQAASLLRCTKAQASPHAQMVSIANPRYENTVATLLPYRLKLSQLQQAVAAEPVYRRLLLRNQLPYHFRLQNC